MTTSIGQGMGKGNPMHTTSGIINQCSCGGKSTEISQETKNRATTLASLIAFMYSPE